MAFLADVNTSSSGRGRTPADYPLSILFINRYTYMHTYMHASIHACIHPSIQALTNTCIHLCMHPSMHPSLYPRRHASVHVCMHASIHVCVHACIPVSSMCCQYIVKQNLNYGPRKKLTFIFSQVNFGNDWNENYLQFYKFIHSTYVCRQRRTFSYICIYTRTHNEKKNKPATTTKTRYMKKQQQKCRKCCLKYHKI